MLLEAMASQASARTIALFNLSIWPRPLATHQRAARSRTVLSVPISRRLSTSSPAPTPISLQQPVPAVAACRTCPPLTRWTVSEDLLSLHLPVAWISSHPRVTLLVSPLSSKRSARNDFKRSWWIWRRRSLFNSARTPTIVATASSKSSVQSKSLLFNETWFNLFHLLC